MAKNYDFNDVEPRIIDFWAKKKIYPKVLKKNKGQKKFYFLDGPPYTSGRIHIGHAWNKSLKDIILRYKRMRGFDVWDRAGYDMHGMPTEQATMKHLGMKSKDEVRKMGVAKFVTECRSLALANMEQMNKDFKRLGVWMDFDNAYMPITPEYIEGEWWLIKKAHENSRLYRGEKTMTWCAGCETSLAKHELEYSKLNDQSIFLKFKVLGSEDEYLIIWTTTPWTIPFNLGVMVGPDIDYIKAEVDGERWIVAKDLADSVIVENAGKKNYEILEEIKGSELEGIKYRHPLHDELGRIYDELEKESDKVHSVVLSSEYVTTEAGSGLVHMAPGCGPEDYEVGHRNHIKPFNNLSRSGVFPKEMGPFAGWKAKVDDSRFVEYFGSKKDMLLAKNNILHDYAHCWRCKQPVIYRTTKQWFFKIEDLKENMRELNKEIYWVPDYAGSKSYDSWLENLRDNGITRQIYWGTPLPIWKCNKCENYVVIGSLKELKAYSSEIPEDLHKPWIDEVNWKCRCGGKMQREPDVLDVWIDAGSASWNCIGFPKDKKLFEEMFPADFILEGIDQIRGWFNLLFVNSMVSLQKPSFKSVYMHGFINDAQGRKMSKSLGNTILPDEVVEKYGADTLRHYMVGAANPGQDINYNFDDMKIKHKNLGILWNLKNLLIDMGSSNGFVPGKLDKSKFGLAEKYIISKMHSSIKRQTEMLDGYMLNETPWVPEELFLELSRTYIQLVRDRMSLSTEDDKQLIFDVLFEVISTTLKIFAPIAPFVTEDIYLQLKDKFGLELESIHMADWPGYDSASIDEQLEDDFAVAKDVIQSILYAREKAQLGQRWPIKEVSVVSINDSVLDSVERLKDIILLQTNIKKINVAEKLKDIKITLRPNIGELGKDFGAKKDAIIERLLAMEFEALLKELKSTGHRLKIDGEDIVIEDRHVIVERQAPEHLVETLFRHGHVYLDTTRTDELEAEGYAREMMRRIQSLRKKADLTRADPIDLLVEADENMLGMLEGYSDVIKEKVGAESIRLGKDLKHHAHKSEEKVKGNRVVISLKKDGKSS